MDDKKPKLLDRVRLSLRQQNYALSTERTYVSWIKRYIIFHDIRHPQEMGEEIKDFLTDLATNKKVAPSTRKQALSALIYLYEQVLGIELDDINVLRPRRNRHLPTVLTQEEAQKVLSALEGVNALMAKLIYGGGMRISLNVCVYGSRILISNNLKFLSGIARATKTDSPCFWIC